MGRPKGTTKVRLGFLFVAMDMPKMEYVFFLTRSWFPTWILQVAMMPCQNRQS